MNLDGIDLGSIGNILGSMSADDIESLKGVAQAMFSSGETEKEKPKNDPPKSQTPNFDFSSFAKIASVMNLLSSEQNDPRTDLLKALKPMLSGEKQAKVDEAIRMISLFAILPKIKELGNN